MGKDILNCEFCGRDFSGNIKDFKYCLNVICEPCYQKENDKLCNAGQAEPTDGDYEGAILESQEDESWGV